MTAKQFIEAVEAADKLTFKEFAARLGRDDRKADNLWFVTKDIAKLLREYKDDELSKVLGLEA